MKKPFNLSAITADLPTFPEEGATPREDGRIAYPAVPIAKAIAVQHRNAMEELKALQAAIEHQKGHGLLIEEIDTALADPSPYWDRDVRFQEDKSFIELVEDMRRNGQQSPALARPHPTRIGRFEVCFGHRRLFACKAIGVRFRVVVRALSEAQMAGAAYSENARREGVSILEQSRALAKYIDRGVFATKQALADELGVSRSHVSNLTSFAEIPDQVLEALGDWRQCTFRDANNLLKAVREPSRREQVLEAAKRLIGSDSKLGFSVRLAVLLDKRAATPVDADDLRDDRGHVIAQRRRGKRSTAIAFTTGQSDALAEFVWAKMPSLVDEFRRQLSGRK